MSKYRVILLAILTALLLCAGACAADSEKTGEAQEGQLAAIDAVGINLTWTEDMNEKEGILAVKPLGPIDFDRHVYGLAVSFMAASREETLEKVNSGNITDAELIDLFQRQNLIVMLLATDQDLQTIRQEYEEAAGTSLPLDFIMLYPLDFDKAEEIGRADGYTFYAIPAISDEYLSRIEKNFAEEYTALRERWTEAARNGEFYAPTAPAEDESERKLRFTTTDTEGNAVTSEALFSGNEITMVNCWGIWCPNCMEEMEELARIHARLREKGCGIVGLEWEQDEAMYRESAQTLQSYGITYPNAIIPEEMLSLVSGFPTTFFVDSEGTILCNPIAGARVDAYETILDDLLAQRKGSDEKTEGAAGPESAVGNAVYRVRVTDEAGPVEEVAIQFCDDTMCTLRETGADGTVTFEAPAGKEYKVHVIDAPEAYQEDPEEYIMSADSTELSIQLRKAD